MTPARPTLAQTARVGHPGFDEVTEVKSKLAAAAQEAVGQKGEHDEGDGDVGPVFLAGEGEDGEEDARDGSGDE